MTRFLTTTALALATTFSAGLAHAQDQDDMIFEDVIVTPKKIKDLWFHVDASFALTQFSVTEGNTEYVSDMMTAGYVRAGVKYKYVGAEVELGTGFSDYEEDGVTLGVDSQTSVFGVLRLPQERSDIYLRLGYHQSDIAIDILGQNFDTDDSGFAGGIGGTYFFTDNIGARLDITGYNLSDPLDVSYVGGSAGLTARF